MTNVKSVVVALLTAATFATPALAREGHVVHRKATDAYASVTPDTCVRAPDVGAFASDPWTKPPCEPNTGF
jgi:hypothetical protein